jgi:thiol-disulfide isomerase/thioredoxin
MKSFILFTSFYLLIFSVKSQTIKSDSVFINGKIIGRDTGIIKLSYLNKYQIWVNDTVRVKNGRFSFTCLIVEPTLVKVSGNIKPRSIDEPNITEIFIEPNRTNIILTENDFKNAKVEDSRSQALIYRLNALKKVVDESSKPLAERYSVVKEDYANGDTSKMLLNKMENIKDQLKPYQDKKRKIDLEFVRNHNDEFISSYLLGYYVNKIPQDSLQFYYNLLTPSVKNNIYGQTIYDVLNAEKKPVLSIGDIAPNIMMYDINGNLINMESFKSQKYILLDFWASWCIPCRRMNPSLKKIHKNYNDTDLEIISLSFDFNETNWKKAIVKDSLGSWKHILVGLNGESADHIRNNYGVMTVPNYILINKQGIIIGIYDEIDENKKEGLFKDLKSELSQVYD